MKRVALSETASSPFLQVCLDALACVFPGLAGRLAAQHAPCTALDLGGPGGLNFVGIISRTFQAREQFRG